MPITAPVRSPLDADRFAIEVARLSLAPGDRLDLDAPPLDSGAYDLVIARCAADDGANIAALEAAGGRLMDVHVSFDRDLADADADLDPDDEPIDVATAADADAISALCRSAFARSTGHYHADPRLPADRCTELYADWGRRLAIDPAVTVVVQRDAGGGIIGLATFSLDEPAQQATVALDAVHEDHRGTGTFARLGRQRLALARRAGADRIVTAVHLQNVASCRANERIGFRIASAELTFHIWRRTPEGEL
ncbi:GNAT family N-acetyltransferase [Nitriliruptor alkaliphilus]|uniref:GNAT family N-acetyltransferase n=1 Tax=Nitriliruptor alkaliphilus TaxID=427918 RepID=UPI000699058F|nr:GNAT family N-acetyltransferase [Nitriliruptor alkaliphilus]